MKNNIIKISAAVPELKVANTEFNAGKIIEIIKSNIDSSLIVFPELCVVGYTCADLFFNENLLRKSEKSVEVIAAEVPDSMTVLVGAPVVYNNEIFNCCVFLSGGKVCAVTPKIYVPNYGEFYERRWFASGRDVKNAEILYAGEIVPFGSDVLVEDKLSGAVVGAEICEDLWVPDKPSTGMCLAGANIIANLSASDETIGKEDFRREMVNQQSASCYCGYIYVSSGTDESSTDMVFSGHTLISENGKLLKESIFPEKNHVESSLIDLQTILYNRLHQSTFENTYGNFRKISVNIPAVGGKNEIDAKELADALNKENYYIARNPFIPSDDNQLHERCEKILRIQANGLATRVRSTGIKTLVLGVSGGLDSALALIVCREAKKIEKDIKIIALTMPNEGNTSSLTYKNSVELPKAVGCELREVSIGEDVKRHLEKIGHGADYKGEGDTAYENAQARMRTYILMDTANMENGLVVGTGDLSELALGWCTYNGDHMSMYAVNSSVPKTLVRYICSAYAKTCGDERLEKVLMSIVNTPITPELTPNKNGEIAQKTEEKIGKYDLNDFFLFYHLRYGFTPERILAFAMRAYPEIDEKFLAQSEIRFFTRFFRQQFKRSCLPDGPKVGSVTLSPRGDWRMPSDADPCIWKKQLEKIAE